MKIIFGSHEVLKELNKSRIGNKNWKYEFQSIILVFQIRDLKKVFIVEICLLEGLWNEVRFLVCECVIVGVDIYLIFRKSFGGIVQQCLVLVGSRKGKRHCMASEGLLQHEMVVGEEEEVLGIRFVEAPKLEEELKERQV